MNEKQEDFMISFTAEDSLNARISYNLLFEKIKDASKNLHAFCVEIGLTPDMEDLIRHHEMISITAMGKICAHFSCQMGDVIEILAPEETEYVFQDAP